jgi:hypothetical protein
MTVTSSESANGPARLQGKRVALALVITVAVTFIGASALQIVPAVFGAGVKPLPSSPQGSSARACAEGVRALLHAVDSADPDQAALAPEWERVGRSCESTPEGLDAWAALMRLRSAARVASRGDRIELDPLRRDVAAHLPAELR